MRAHQLLPPFLRISLQIYHGKFLRYAQRTNHFDRKKKYLEQMIQGTRNTNEATTEKAKTERREFIIIIDPFEFQNMCEC